MGFFGLTEKREPRLDRRHSLAGVPVLAKNVSIDRTDDAKWVMTVTTRPRSRVLARFLPPTFVKRVELDELGTSVLRQIDGERTVQGIVDAFRRLYNVNRREAELSVAEFLRSLVRRHVVAIVIR